MGSVQSQNSMIPQSDIQIIITSDDEANFPERDTHDEEEEEGEEYFECLTDFNLAPYNFDNEKRKENGGSSGISSTDENEIERECEKKTLAHTLESGNEKKQTQFSESDGEDDDESNEERKERLKKELDDFRKELLEKRSMCQESINKWRVELTELREKYNKEVLLNEQMREMMEERGISALSSENRQLKLELAECQMFLQTANSENINVTMENQALREHIRSLKEVILATKEMLSIRESQVNQLKSKLTEIEVSFSEKETKIMSTELQKEYQRQLENIRNMRELYEERANLLTQERDKLKRQLEEKEQDVKTEIEKAKNLQEHINIVEDNLKLKNTDISMLESEISQMKFEKEKVLTEMNTLNQLFAQVLYDFNASGNKIDLENLHNMLEQNRVLLSEIISKEEFTIEDDEKLPKLLYDLFLHVNKSTSNNENVAQNENEGDSKKNRVSTPEDIAEKLPKILRIFNEFLSHGANEKAEMDEDEIPKSEDPQAGISVSKTFIRLRDLILQKRSLQRDTGRLKTLYSHLEQRLDKQEKRLSSVSLELTKTWHTVGKIKRQNRQLHTHEQILCYQLQQKRRLLNELKAELEYCRKKWALARAINNDSEEQLEQMRHEFAQRKIQDQNSAESGYSDEHDGVSDGDSDGGCRSDKDRIERFNKNLLTFDKIETTINDEPVMYQFRKWRSESTLLQNFQASSLSRAHSEPQHICDPDENEDITKDLDNYVVFIPNVCVYEDSLQSRIVASDDEDVSQQQSLVINLPPKIHEHSTKRELSKTLKKKKKKSNKNKNCQNRGESESAEAMFMRLLSTMNNEQEDKSTTTSTVSSIEGEEDDEENSAHESIEEIHDIPVDDVSVEQEPQLTDNIKDNQTDEANEESTEINCEEKEKKETTATTSKNSLSSVEEDFLARREIRLSRLEAEAKEFYERMNRNKERSLQLNNHLDSVHQSFLDRHQQQQREKDSNSQKDEATASSSQEKTKKNDKEEENEDERQD